MIQLPDEYACSAVLYDVLGTSLPDESSQLGEFGGDRGSSDTLSSEIYNNNVKKVIFTNLYIHASKHRVLRSWKL